MTNCEQDKFDFHHNYNYFYWLSFKEQKLFLKQETFKTSFLTNPLECCSQCDIDRTQSLFHITLLLV